MHTCVNARQLCVEYFQSADEFIYLNYNIIASQQDINDAKTL